MLAPAFDTFWLGSLPHNAAESVKIATQTRGSVPYSPQNPKTSPDGFLLRDPGLLAPALDKLKREGFHGVFKLQLAGPTTSVCKEHSVWAKDIKPLAEKVLAAGMSPLIMIDEPVFPRTEAEHSALEHAIGEIHAAGAQSGLHTCAKVLLSELFQTGADIIHFDMHENLNGLSAAETAIREHLRAGRAIAWGIVPTTKTADAKQLADSLGAILLGLRDFGLPIGHVVTRSAVSPACGFGLLSVAQANRVIDCVTRVSKLLKIRYKTSL